MKRLISCYASDVINMKRDELKNAILASEGRTILGETVVTAAPLLEGVTNAEVMSSFGADMILLNLMYLKRKLMEWNMKKIQ